MFFFNRFVRALFCGGRVRAWLSGVVSLGRGSGWWVDRGGVWRRSRWVDDVVGSVGWLGWLVVCLGVVGLVWDWLSGWVFLCGF